MSSPWSDLGLAWASLEPTGVGRLARALLRWERLSPTGRTALRQLVLDGRQPTDAAATELVDLQLVACEQTLYVPLYPGAGLIGLDEERRVLHPSQSAVLVQWYCRHSGGLSVHGGVLRLRKIYQPFEAEVDRRDAPTLATLHVRMLVGRAGRQVYRSMLRGWGVARLAEDAARSIAVVGSAPEVAAVRMGKP